MRVKSKISAILKSTSGVSLIFVLGIMLLLMAIGTSVLTAASANRGANIRQNNYNRAVILGDSVHRNIMHSLQLEPESPGFEDSLAFQLVWAIYDDDANDRLLTPPGYQINPPKIVLEAEINDRKIDMLSSVELQFSFIEVSIAGPIDFVPEIPKDRIPRTASISARMVVTVVVEVEAVGLTRNETRLITSKAIYEFSGGVLTDDPDGAFAEEPPGSDALADLDMVFAPGGYGTWSLVSYEIIESESEPES